MFSTLRGIVFQVHMLELPADPAQIPDIIVYLVSMRAERTFRRYARSCTRPHWAHAHGALRQEGDGEKQKRIYAIYGKKKNVMSAQMLEVPLLGVGTMPRLEKDA